MLLNARYLNSDIVNPYFVDPDAFDAALAGDIAPLGKKNGAEQPEEYKGSVADLLLSSPSTAVMHFERPPSAGEVNARTRGRSVMMAVNYHDGHSEEYHKIVVQDPLNQDDGQWGLWIPPGSRNRTFYRRVFHNGEDHPFEEEPINPSKIREYYLHFGNSSAALEDFRAAGFKFSEDSPGDKRDTDSEAYRLNTLSLETQDRWDPFADE